MRRAPPRESLLSSSIVSSSVVALTACLRAAGCVFAEDEAALLLAAATTPVELETLVAERVAGRPLEQVVGWAEFCGLRITVEPGVFVPRRRTELLVRSAVTGAPARPVVVDLCCGSGAVGLALLHALDRPEVHACDVDPAAVACARRNLEPAGGAVHEGDLWAALPVDLRGRLDLVVANAPYVPTGAIGLMPPEARLHEPRAALDGGDDGVDVQRRIARAARAWLAPSGRLLVETSEQQTPETVDALSRAGLSPRVVRSEDLDATVVVGTAPARRPEQVA